jgi:hypothetical protein
MDTSTPSRNSHFAIEDMDSDGITNSRRLCKVEANRKSYEAQETEVTRVSTEKLLEASLQSLETMNLRKSQIQSRGDYHEDQHDSIMRLSIQAADDHAQAVYPSASYLRGALWLGRNMAIVIEDLAKAMDQCRMRILTGLQQVDVREAQPHEMIPELKRAIHRLKVMATGATTQACTFTAKTKSLIRSILQVDLN